MINKEIFKKFGPALLVLALGIGSGELILWPYLTANYGFGLLWGALLGISLQLLLINIISRNTLIFNQNIIKSFSMVFPWIFPWIIFSTLIGFGWPGFSSLSSQLIVDGYSLSGWFVDFLPLFILTLSAFILILSKNAYKAILKIEKIAMLLLFLLSIYFFWYYFNLNDFISMIKGLFGFGDGYFLFPEGFLIGATLAAFVGAVAYAGSGGNLLLLNSNYVLEENKGKINSDKINEKIKNIFSQNFLFFWAGGLFIILILSYISKVSLEGVDGLTESFVFLVKEAEIFRNDLGWFFGDAFIFLGALAIFGVQMGIFDFMGRLSVEVKNFINKEKISDKFIYNLMIFIAWFLGSLILLSGFDQPKTLIILGAIINSFSMGIIALLLLLLEIKKIPSHLKSKKIIYSLLFAFVFYISFFLFVLFDKF